ncbi:hypothetical protein MRB53_037445 [Persea americana]|nr:hypothetical protein MRB53_037445 [Persea americana]
MAAAQTGSDLKVTSNSGQAARQPAKGNAGRALDSARKSAASPVDSQSARKQNTAPKAWQGTNPITSRANSASPQINGIDKPRSPASASRDQHIDKHAHDRSLFLLANMTKSTYILKMVKRSVQSANPQVNGGSISDEYAGSGEDHEASFEIQETVDLSVKDVTASATKSSNGSVTPASSFRTDTEISASNTFRQRELQRWEPGPADMSLDDMGIEESNTNGWDQFAANEQKYGVKSSYDEEMYTTSIDRSHPQYAKRMAEAERLAREIEGSAAPNSHVAEERAQTVQDDGLTEEDRYSGVRREELQPLSRGAAGSYVPPSRRPITSQPTVPGAPYDPAIISSQLAKPRPSQEQAGSAPQPVNDENQNVPIPSPIPTAKASPNTTEDRVRDTADAFKAFANNEKMRIRQAQEQKRTNARLEKNVRINDLKKFAENFKLKSRVPDDLVPILAKDHEKQVEIKRKADEAARVEEVRSKEDAQKSSTVSAPQSAAVTSPIPAQLPRTKTQPNRSQFVPQLTPGMSPRQAQLFKGMPRQAVPPQAVVNIPSGPASAAPQPDVLSPASNTRLNVKAKAFEFRPGANNFTPTGSSPSPQRIVSAQTKTPPSFFSDQEKESLKTARSRKNEEDADVLVWLRVSGLNGLTEDQKKSLIPNGGIPQAYRTAPTWQVPDDRLNLSYEDAFPKPNTHGPSPMHTPNGMAQIHHQQLPPNMHQNGPPMQNRYLQGQNMPHPQGYDPRLQYQNGPSAHNSPRFPQAQIYNGQMVGQMPQFAGQPMQYPGMSPNMSQRQLHMPQQGMMPGHYGSSMFLS